MKKYIYYITLSIVVAVAFIKSTYADEIDSDVIYGEVVAAEGTRVKIRTDNGEMLWVSVADSDTTSLIGLRISGTVVEAGDISYLESVTYNN